MTDDTQRHVSEGDAGGRDTSRYSVTVKQASQMFDDAGVPRSERSIQRYCKRGHLDCYLLDREQDQTYLIDAESLERRIEELRQVMDSGVSPNVAPGRVTTRHDAPERDTSRQGATGDDNQKSDERTSEELEELRKEIKRLKDENQVKEVEIRVKEHLLVSLNEQRRADLEKVAELAEQKGELKSQLLALQAPSSDSDSNQKTEKGSYREAEYTDQNQTTINDALNEEAQKEQQEQ